MKKYSKFLTVLLVILAISLIILVGYAIYTLYDDYLSDKSAEDLMAQFENNYDEEDYADGNSEDLTDNNSNNNNNDNNNSNNNNKTSNGKKTSSGGSSYGLGTYYKGYKVIGIISIPKLNIQYPIFKEDTTQTLKVGTAAIYPADAENVLNSPGNVVIAGHNYRNSRMFSKLNKLNNGDSIYITNEYGVKLEYKVYNNYTTGSMDFDYATRETNGGTEISLTTCTTDASTRTIVWAKAQ